MYPPKYLEDWIKELLEDEEKNLDQQEIDEIRAEDELTFLINSIENGKVNTAENELDNSRIRVLVTYYHPNEKPTWTADFHYSLIQEDYFQAATIARRNRLDDCPHCAGMLEDCQVQKHLDSGVGKSFGKPQRQLTERAGSTNQPRLKKQKLVTTTNYETWLADRSDLQEKLDSGLSTIKDIIVIAVRIGITNSDNQSIQNLIEDERKMNLHNDDYKWIKQAERKYEMGFISSAARRLADFDATCIRCGGGDPECDLCQEMQSTKPSIQKLSPSTLSFLDQLENKQS